MPARRDVRTEKPARLQPHEIEQIEAAISRLEGDGKVYLIIKKGHLRFIQVAQQVELGNSGDQ